MGYRRRGGVQEKGWGYRRRGGVQEKGWGYRRRGGGTGEGVGVQEKGWGYRRMGGGTGEGVGVLEKGWGVQEKGWGYRRRGGVQEKGWGTGEGVGYRRRGGGYSEDHVGDHYIYMSWLFHILFWLSLSPILIVWLLVQLLLPLMDKCGVVVDSGVKDHHYFSSCDLDRSLFTEMFVEYLVPPLSLTHSHTHTHTQHMHTHTPEGIHQLFDC